MLDPSSLSASVLIAVKTGAITTSQWLALATSGFKASAVSTASPSSLYIFQFPAMTGFLIRIWSLDLGLGSWAFVIVSVQESDGQSTKIQNPKAKDPSPKHLVSHLSFNAATPGNCFPARNSSVAPPPVEM